MNAKVALVAVLAVAFCAQFASANQFYNKPGPLTFYGNTTWVIYNTLIIDGLGTTPFYGNIWMANGTIIRLQPSVETADIAALTTQLQEYSPASAYMIIPASGTYAVPGFIDVNVHTAMQSVLPAINSATDMTSIAADVTAAFSTNAQTAQARQAITQANLKGALNAGTTTVYDMYAVVDDFAANIAAVNAAPWNYPNYQSCGPLIGFSTAAPSEIAAVSDVFIPITPHGVNGFNATSFLLNKFNAFPQQSCLLLSMDNGLGGNQMDSATAFAVAAAGRQAGLVLFYTATATATIQLGAQAGFKILVNPPLDYTTGTPVVASGAFTSLMSYGVSVTSSLGWMGGAIKTYLNDFGSGFTYPNPSAVVYFPYSMYNYLPASVMAIYEGIFSAYAFGSSSAVRLAYANAVTQLQTAQSALNSANYNGINAVCGSQSGYPFSFFGNNWMEAVLAYNEPNIQFNMGVNTTLKALQMLTINAAQAVKADQFIGSITIGKYADIVLLGQNPLVHVDNLRTVLAVFKFGYQHIIYTNTGVAIGVGLGAAGFAILIILLFVIWAKACANAGQGAKLGDIAASAL